MATFVASTAQSDVMPRALYAGVQAVYGEYTLTATLSAGDVIKIVKVPHGARIVDTILKTSGALGDAGKLNVGDDGDHDRLIASADASVKITGQHINTGEVGYKYTVSDAAVNRYKDILVTASDFTGTGTASAVIGLMVLYHLDQP